MQKIVSDQIFVVNSFEINSTVYNGLYTELFEELRDETRTDRKRKLGAVGMWCFKKWNRDFQKKTCFFETHKIHILKHRIRRGASPPSNLFFLNLH